MLSLLMALIGIFHGFSLGGFAITGVPAIKYGVLYALGFILVGIFEEFSFRGYMQSTLASGIGFWPAAIVLGILFGAIHLQNSGEAIYGAVMAGGFGLVAAFSLRAREIFGSRLACTLRGTGARPICTQFLIADSSRKAICSILPSMDQPGSLAAPWDPKAARSCF